MTPARPEAPARWRLGVLSLAVATACAVPDYGAQYRTLPEVSDACLLELDVPADIGAEFSWSLFDCINRRSGYFDELESLAWYATHDDEAAAYLFPAPVEETPDTPVTPSDTDEAGGGLMWTLNFATDLIRYPTDPVDQVAQMYATLHDDYPDLMILAGSTVAAMAEQVATCESEWDPADPSSERCHVLRLTRRLLDRQDIIDGVERVLDTLERAADEPEEPATWQDAVRGIAGILERSTARSDNPLIDLARSAIGRIDDESKLVRALGLARQVLLLEDEEGAYAFDMIASENGLADHLARLWRNGSLQAAPDEVDWLFSHDINGFEVPVGGDETVVASLSSALSDLTFASETDPVLLDTLVEVINNLYLNEADLGELVGSLSDAIAVVCNDSGAPLPESLVEVCGLADAALPAVEAMTVHAPHTMRTGLAVVYVYSQFHRVVSPDDPATYNLDLDLVLGGLEFIQSWEELSGLEVLDDGTPSDTTMGEAIASGLAYVPLFINTDLGRLTSAGEDAMQVVDFVTGPWVYDEASGETLATPLLVVAPLFRSILFAEELGHDKIDLDRWMEVASLALLGGSAINVDGIASLLDIFDAVTAQVDALLAGDAPEPADASPSDPFAEIKALIDDTSQWVPLVKIAADPVFIDLIVPHPYPHQEAWQSDAQFWIKERLERGLMGRILDWTGNLLHRFGLGSEAEAP